MTSYPSKEATGLLKLPKIVVFACVGAANTAVDFTLFTALVGAAHWPPALANMCSYSAAICVSFALNRNMTFRQAKFRHRAHQQFARFAMVNLAALALSTALVHFFAQFTAPVIAKLLSIPATFAWGFLGARYIVFLTEQDHARPAERAGIKRTSED